ncbi:hypothetical protein L1987_18479 [Smallanthus sonchifolius]|uniref:Uncharacterized protein n=1 Tax=Smallanthus sonchifolius TaxID=185202 RepID=A0ACB9J399_9ASTR|nr:hypothetical protein L1987_18479 [Smallanthus sonchifolius]
MYTISIRNSYDLKELDIVELHSMLKTCELEMSQDSKILNNKKGAGIIEESVNVKFSEASSLEPIIGPNALFDLDTFLQTFSHADVDAEAKLSLDKGKEKEDNDYRVSFRRPSIDPPFIVESSSAADTNTATTSNVSNFDFDTEQDIPTKEENDSDDVQEDIDTEDVQTEEVRITSLGIARFNDNESSRLLILALKKRGFNVYEEEKKEEEPLQIIPILSWELLGKIWQFVITYQNGIQEYLPIDKIVTLVPNDLKALLKIPLKNGDGDEEKREQCFRNEDNHDSSDVGETPADTEVPLAQSQIPISKWYYDQDLKKFGIKWLEFTFSTFSELVDLSVLSPVELKLLRLMPMSSTTEEGTKFSERIRQSTWTVKGQEEAVPFFTYVPTT